MTSLELINQNFEESIQSKIETADKLVETISAVADCLTSCIENGGKLIICGDGINLPSAMYFTSLLVNHYKIDRPPLSAVCLSSDPNIVSAISSSYGYDDVFARQLSALGNDEDILIAISTRRGSNNIINAIKEAHDLEIPVISITSMSDEFIGDILSEDDLNIKLPITDEARIQENVTLIINCLCDNIEHKLFLGLEES